MPRIKYDEGEKPLYTVKKDGAMYRVLDSRGTVMFSTLTRINATDWVKNNSPKEQDANP